MKNRLIFIILLLFCLTEIVFSQRDSVFVNNAHENDSSEINFRLTLGYNIYSPIEDSYHLNIKNGYGWNLGFLFSITKKFEIEGTFAFYNFSVTQDPNTDYSLKANINHIGIRLYPYRENWAFYLGLGMSWDNFTQYLNNMYLDKEYCHSKNSFVIPFGITYDLSRKFALDFSIRPGMYYPSLGFDRVVFNLSLIYDIDKFRKD